MIRLLSRLFPQTDRTESLRDWRLYLTCRVTGHRITDPDDRGDRYCSRCGDTMFGDNRFQA